VKTVSGKVLAWHPLAYLTVGLHKWFVGDLPLNVDFVRKDTHHQCRIKVGDIDAAALGQFVK